MDVTRIYTPFVCMGICRFLGTVGFFGCSTAAYRALGSSWNLPTNPFTVTDYSALGRTGAVALGMCAAAGFLGLTLGQVAGSSVRVKGNDLSLRLNVFWHCVANGSMVWLLYAGAVTALTIGDKSRIRSFAQDHGAEFFWSSWAIALIGSAVIAAVVGQLLTRRNRCDQAGEIAMLILPLAVGIPMGLAESQLWDLSWPGAVIMGFVFPLSVTQVSSGMWERDQASRMPPESEQVR